MKKYRVSYLEAWYRDYEVHAENEEEAKKIADSYWDNAVPGDFEYSDMLEVQIQVISPRQDKCKFEVDGDEVQ